MFVLTVLVCLVLVEVLMLLKLVYSLSSFASYWTKQNNTSQSEVKYLALGDSAAQGIGASRPEKGYVGLLSRHLDAQGHTVNLSVSGARIHDVVTKQMPLLKDYQITSDTVITLDIGGNDMRTFKPGKFHNDMSALMSLLPSQTIVADIPYFGGGRYRQLETNVMAANEILHELAHKYGLKVAPLHDVTEQNDSLLVYSADFFHPSNAGYRNWFEAFRRVLDQ